MEEGLNTIDTHVLITWVVDYLPLACHKIPVARKPMDELEPPWFQLYVQSIARPSKSFLIKSCKV